MDAETSKIIPIFEEVSGSIFGHDIFKSPNRIISAILALWLAKYGQNQRSSLDKILYSLKGRYMQSEIRAYTGIFFLFLLLPGLPMFFSRLSQPFFLFSFFPGAKEIIETHIYVSTHMLTGAPHMLTGCPHLPYAYGSSPYTYGVSSPPICLQELNPSSQYAY